MATCQVGLILICDDNLGVAETHSAILESAGAETAVVDDPRDALEALIEDPDAWDALLTDFDMPHLNGAELAASVRRAPPRFAHCALHSV